MASNTAVVVGIELLAAAQGLEFRRPLKTSRSLEGVFEAVREVAAPYDADRYFAPDLTAAAALVESGRFLNFSPGLTEAI